MAQVSSATAATTASRAHLHLPTLFLLQVRASYDSKPYRRMLMELWGATCHPSPSTITQVRGQAWPELAEVWLCCWLDARICSRHPCCCCSGREGSIEHGCMQQAHAAESFCQLLVEFVCVPARRPIPMPLPLLLLQAGRDILAKDPNTTGSLGIAIRCSAALPRCSVDWLAACW